MTDTVLDAVQQHPFTQGLTPEHCATLASLGRRVSFGKDEIIFREGDPKHEFFLLLTGRVALEMVVQGITLRVQTLGAGDELGWSSVLMGRGKYFQARALEPTEALAFEGVALFDARRQDPAFGFAFMYRMLGVVSERLQATRLQLHDNCRQGGGACLQRAVRRHRGGRRRKSHLCRQRDRGRGDQWRKD